MPADTHTVALSTEDVFAIANSLNQEATRFETMAGIAVGSAEAPVVNPHTRIVWRQHAAELRELSLRVLDARKKNGRRS